MSLVWYFAYGSNMQSGTLRGRRGIDYRRAAPARVGDWRLVLDKPPLFSIGEAFANMVPESGACILGVAYLMSADDLAHIELTEGVVIGNYARVEVDAVLLEVVGDEVKEGETIRVFSLSSEKRGAQSPPSRRYMNLLIEGALEHGLPASYVEELRKIPAGEESALARLARPTLDRFMRRRS